MGAATQLTDFSDLYTDLQNRVRVKTGETATTNQAKRYINIALHDMHLGYREKFPWAERSATLTTQKPYSTGTVTISQGSTSLTGSGTAWNTNNAFGVTNVRAGGKFVINSTVDVYTVSSVSSDTSVTLEEKYIRSDVSGGSYTYFEDEYALHADFLRPLDIRYFDQARTITLLNRREFKSRYVRNKTTGKIIAAMIADKSFNSNTTPVRKAVFHKPPDDYYLIPYSFVTNKLAVESNGTEATQLVNDTDEPIVPLYARHVIVFHALYHWYRDKKNDTRAQEAKGEYTDAVIRLVSDVEIGQSRPQIKPRSVYKRHAARPYRRSRRHVTGTAFDELRD